MAVAPRHAAAHGNLGALCLRAGCPVAAERASRDALALAPDEHRWISNLAVALQMQGRHVESEACYRAALTLRPDYATGHGNLLFALNYRDDVPPEAIFSEYRRWDAQHARGLAPAEPHHALDRTPGRKLRVGYVSPDFRQHAVALFAEPLLAAHDRSQVELFCYAELAVEDAVTARFRALADHWRPTLGVTDDAMAAMIRQDRIDVLVDLAGHTAGNRLLVFARKPAPVQVEYMLGHGYTSGLSAMDAFLADAVLAPAGAEALFSERLVRLPRIPLAYRAPEGMPEVGQGKEEKKKELPLPLREGDGGRGPAVSLSADGHDAFRLAGRGMGGPFHYPHLLPSAPHLRLFRPAGTPERRRDRRLGAHPARPARRAPGTEQPQLPGGRVSRPVRRTLRAHGIGPDQLAMVYTAPQPRTWEAYGAIDIALDPFPHNAGTTTIEALYLGRARPHPGRPAQRGAVRRRHPACGRAGRLDHPRYRRLCRPRPRRRGGSRRPRPDCAANCAPASPPRRCTTPPASPAPSRPPTARCGTRGANAIRRSCSRRFAAGDLAGAASSPNALLARNPADTDAAHVAGLIAYREQRLTDADRHLRTALAATPDNAETHANHAAILRALGRLAEAEAAARTSLAHAPDRAETHNNLGNILRDAARYPESIASFRQALQHNPRFADAWANLAWVLSLQGLPARPNRPPAKRSPAIRGNSNGHNNLGLALMRQSRLREAEAALRQALALRPDFPLPHSNILFCLNYRDDMTAEAIFAEYRQWDAQHARKLAPAQPHYAVDRTPGRRLRVGYVSPDFRQHAVALVRRTAADRARPERNRAVLLRRSRGGGRHHPAVPRHGRSLAADRRSHRRGDGSDDPRGSHRRAGGPGRPHRRQPPAGVRAQAGAGADRVHARAWLHVRAFRHGRVPRRRPCLPRTAPTRCSANNCCGCRASRSPTARRRTCRRSRRCRRPANGHVTFGYFGRTVRLNDAVIATWARILLALPGSPAWC